MAEGMEEISDIPHGFIGKPINTRIFAQNISQFIKLVSKKLISLVTGESLSSPG
jgi:hypothetical protein